MQIISYNSFFVIFEFHDDRFDVFPLTLPLCYALLSIRIEGLLRLVLQGLISKSGMLLVHKILLRFCILFLRLFLEIIREFDSSLSLFFSLLLFSNCKLFISKLPELSKFHFLSLFICNLFLFSVNLVGSTFFNCMLHFQSSSFFFFK